MSTLTELQAVDFPAAVVDRTTLMTREQIAATLTEAGFPVRPATLATKAVRGGGPPFRRFGNKPLYEVGLAFDWALARLGPNRVSTSEHRA